MLYFDTDSVIYVSPTSEHLIPVDTTGEMGLWTSEAEAEDISFFPKLNGLNKCLHLMMYFLDCYVQRHVSPTDVIKEGWSVMAKILRRICVQGPLKLLSEICYYY